MTDEELNAPSYLIVKRGYYYRPNEHGYTSSAIQAGRYTLTEAEKITHPNGVDGPRDGMTFIHEDEVNDEDWKAYTTLRAQLAEAHKDGFQLAAWQCLFDDGKTGIVCDDWGNQYCAMQRRADRAEAALAAQIEADAGMIERIVTEARQEVGSIKLSKVDAAVVEMLSGIAKAIRNQPHDRTALDRHDAKTREKALREAAKTAHECNMAGDPQASSTYILALIEKPNAR